MSSPETHHEAELKSTLDRLEICLLAPMMPGELVRWVEEVGRAWSDATCQIEQHLHKAHPRQYKEIGKEDPELLPRTEKLRQEDAAIDDDRAEFDRHFRRFAEHAPKFEPDEEKIAAHAQLLVNDGVEFITRVRRQEVAVQAWFLEAFTRDRGVAD